MPDDVSKPTLQVEAAAQASAWPKVEARQRPAVDPVEAAREFMDRHPILMASLAG